MGNMKVSIIAYPASIIRVTCGSCGTVAYESTWTNYWDYRRKKEQAEKISCCLKCNKPRDLTSKAIPKTEIKWERTAKGDYQAFVKNGEFLVYKWGSGTLKWRWRFRKAGEQFPERIRVSQTKEEAMKACESHEEWKV